MNSKPLPCPFCGIDVSEVLGDHKPTCYFIVAAEVENAEPSQLTREFVERAEKAWNIRAILGGVQ